MSGNPFGESLAGGDEAAVTPPPSSSKSRTVSGRWDEAFDEQRLGQPTPPKAIPSVVGPGRIKTSIEAHQRMGEGMSAYMAYEIHTQTELSRFKGTSFSVTRRYREFDWLHQRLCETMPGFIVPPLPEKSALSNHFSKEFVDMRRRELERFLKRLVDHPDLSESSDLQVFLEASDEALAKHKVDTAKPVALSLWGIGANLVNSTVYSIPKDTDQWYEDKSAYVQTLEKQLQGFVRSVDRVVRKRRDYAAAFSELGVSARFLGNSETNHQIANVLNSMGGSCERVHALNMDQANDESSFFEVPMKDYMRSTSAAKVMLKNRGNAYMGYHVQDKNEVAKKERYEKLKGVAGKETKAEAAHEDLIEAKQNAVAAKDSLDAMNKSVKSELARFEREKVKDVKSALLKFVSTQIQYETQLQAIWQKLLAEAKNIDATKE